MNICTTENKELLSLSRGKATYNTRAYYVLKSTINSQYRFKIGL